MIARNSCFNKASRWFWFLLKFSLSYIFWAYIFVVDDLDESSRIHIGGLNLSSHLNAPSYFTNHIIQKLKLNFPLSILFTRGRIKTSTWHCKPLLIFILFLYAFNYFLSLQMVTHYNFQDQAFNSSILELTPS